MDKQHPKQWPTLADDLSIAADIPLRETVQAFHDNKLTAAQKRCADRLFCAVEKMVGRIIKTRQKLK